LQQNQVNERQQDNGVTIGGNKSSPKVEHKKEARAVGATGAG
jgi:hypothetical protein